MGVRSTPVSQSLDKKLKIWGYEIPDLLVVFLCLSILNFLFAGHPLKAMLTWLPTVSLAVAIRILKRGKPDNYILHLLRFKLAPKYLSAFKQAKKPAMVRK